MGVVLGIVAVLGVGGAYVLRKGWLAFHKAVGITPGTMIYVPPEQYQPVLLHLPLDKNQLMALPVTMRQKLAQIDQKAQRLQSYHDKPSLHYPDERRFVLVRLLQNELPQAIGHYHRYQHERLSKYSSDVSKFDVNKVDVNKVDVKKVDMPKADDESLQLLEHIMMNVESRLDALLDDHESDSLHELNVIKRYLDIR